MIVRRLKNDELYHHGIKGQEWGVRHGPPYPIEDKVMRKGTKLNSVIRVNSYDAQALKDKDYNKKAQQKLLENKRWLYTYNKDNEWDNKVYKGAFSAYNYQRGAAAIAECQYEVIKDLKMPTKKERFDNFKALYDDKKMKKAVQEETKSTCKLLIRYGVGNNKERAEYKRILNRLDNLKTEQDWKTAYDIFNHMMENNYYYKSTREYSKNMAEKFDAMVDDNNQGKYNRAQDPVIIFRTSEALKVVGDIRVMDVKEIADNYNEVKEELKKHGENLKL